MARSVSLNGNGRVFLPHTVCTGLGEDRLDSLLHIVTTGPPLRVVLCSCGGQTKSIEICLILDRNPAAELTLSVVLVYTSTAPQPLEQHELVSLKH